MEKLITNTKNLFKSLALSACMGMSLISSAQDSKPIPGCDASFKDITPVVVIPANIPTGNLKVFEAVNKDYQKYSWDFGDGTSDTGSTVKHYFPSPGKYFVTLKVYNPTIGMLQVICNDAKSQWITVGQENNCDASFKVLDIATIPGGLGRSFQANNEKIAHYRWDFGDGTTDTLSKVFHVFPKPGKYYVSLTVYDIAFGCKNMTGQWITIGSDVNLCDASFTSNVYMVKTNPPQYFVDYKAINQEYRLYTWDFGDGTSDTGRTITHRYKTAGEYKVTLKVFTPTIGNLDVTCEDVKTQIVKVGEVAPPINRCIAELTQEVFKNTVKIQDKNIIRNIRYDGVDVKYEWHWGDGTTSNTAEVGEHTYKAGGTYTITLVKYAIFNPCYDQQPIICKALPYEICREKYIMSVYINDIPNEYKCNANISHSISGQLAKFHDDLFIDYFRNDLREEHLWNFGDGSTGSGRFVEHFYAKPGVYNVTLTKNLWLDPCPRRDSGVTCAAVPSIVCSTIQNVTVTIGNSTCEAKVSYSTDYLTVNIQDNAIPVYPAYGLLPKTEYYWNFGDGTTSKGNPSTHTYASPGVYKVKLTKISYYLTLAKNDTTLGNAEPVFKDTVIAVPARACTSYAEVEVRVIAKEPICNAYLTTSIKDNKVYYRTWNKGKNIGYAKIDFGDGNYTETNGSSLAGVHTYTKNGSYQICVRIASAPDSVLPYTDFIDFCSASYCDTITVGGIVPVINGVENEPVFTTIVKAFPIPAADKVTLQITNATSVLSLKLMNATGLILKEVKDITNGSNEIDLHDIDNGIYFYTLFQGEQKVYSNKLVVSK